MVKLLQLGSDSKGPDIELKIAITPDVFSGKIVILKAIVNIKSPLFFGLVCNWLNNYYQLIIVITIEICAKGIDRPKKICNQLKYYLNKNIAVIGGRNNQESVLP
jgi:hypothetical protein